MNNTDEELISRLERLKIEKKDPTYEEVITEINNACKDIKMEYAKGVDGRLSSALSEEKYLKELSDNLKKSTKYNFKIENPKARYWYDIRINDIPINLKMTTGGTDNAYNKVAIIYTLTGKESTLKSMNDDKLYKYLTTNTIKKERDIKTEYHYLVVDKESGNIILKSILDIHSYKSNPCNTLQINWKNEFANKSYKIDDTKYFDKVIELLKTIQKSLKQSVEGKMVFVKADINKDFKPKK